MMFTSAAGSQNKKSTSNNSDSSNRGFNNDKTKAVLNQIPIILSVNKSPTYKKPCFDRSSARNQIIQRINCNNPIVPTELSVEPFYFYFLFAEFLNENDASMVYSKQIIPFKSVDKLNVKTDNYVVACAKDSSLLLVPLIVEYGSPNSENPKLEKDQFSIRRQSSRAAAEWNNFFKENNSCLIGTCTALLVVNMKCYVFEYCLVPFEYFLFELCESNYRNFLLNYNHFRDIREGKNIKILVELYELFDDWINSMQFFQNMDQIKAAIWKAYSEEHSSLFKDISKLINRVSCEPFIVLYFIREYISILLGYPNIDTIKNRKSQILENGDQEKQYQKMFPLYSIIEYKSEHSLDDEALESILHQHYEHSKHISNCSIEDVKLYFSCFNLEVFIISISKTKYVFKLNDKIIKFNANGITAEYNNYKLVYPELPFEIRDEFFLLMPYLGDPLSSIKNIDAKIFNNIVHYSMKELQRVHNLGLKMTDIKTSNMVFQRDSQNNIQVRFIDFENDEDILFYTRYSASPELLFQLNNNNFTSTKSSTSSLKGPTSWTYKWDYWSLGVALLSLIYKFENEFPLFNISNANDWKNHMMKQNHLGFVDLNSPYFGKWNINLDSELKVIGKRIAQKCLQFDHNFRNFD